MPARTKAQSSGLGKTIINRKIKESKINPQSLKYTQEAEQLKTVTHETDLDDFLNSAALADTDFTAERTNVKVISAPSIPSSQNPFLLSKQQERDVAKKQGELKGGLRVPRRPAWTKETTRDELERTERESFLEWRRGLADLQENNGLLLTPFERNLQVWRQLWRVLERSQLIVQIVDARNPRHFRCEDLEAYVKELRVGSEGGSIEEEEAEGAAGPGPSTKSAGIRKSLLLVNKADLLTRKQRLAWADYFSSQGIQYAFFSAFAATQEQEAAEKLRRKDEEDDDVYDHREPQYLGSDSEDGDEEEEEYVSDGEEVEGEDEGDEGDEDEFVTDDEEETMQDQVQIAVAESLEADQQGQSGADLGAEHAAQRLGKMGIEEAEDEDKPQVEGGVELRPGEVLGEGEEGRLQAVEEEDEEDEGEEDLRTRVLSVQELEDLFEAVAPPLAEFATSFNPNPTKLMIGLVGYPNVGKSSTINALLGSKKVSVSSTPGKTKHFQTLPFSSKITLCDCPGLVFPQFVNTQADMVCDGVLPIDQMREASAPIELVCRRIPREILEGIYGIRIDVREIEDGGTGQVHWEDLLSTYAIARGLTRASFGMPDTSRAARFVLKDYVNARLVYCHPPPGIDADAYMSSSRSRSLKKIEEAEKAGKKKAPLTRVGKGADTFVAAAPSVALPTGTPAPEVVREKQATSKSVRQSAASAPARSASATSKALDGSFFQEEGPSARPVAKGVVGAGLKGGYSRTQAYPHTQKLGSDGLPIEGGAEGPRIVHAVSGRDGSKKHFKMKEGKKRSGKGYD